MIVPQGEFETCKIILFKWRSFTKFRASIKDNNNSVTAEKISLTFIWYSLNILGSYPYPIQRTLQFYKIRRVVLSLSRLGNLCLKKPLEATYKVPTAQITDCLNRYRFHKQYIKLRKKFEIFTFQLRKWLNLLLVKVRFGNMNNAETETTQTSITSRTNNI